MLRPFEEHPALMFTAFKVKVCLQQQRCGQVSTAPRSPKEEGDPLAIRELYSLARSVVAGGRLFTLKAVNMRAGWTSKGLSTK